MDTEPSPLPVIDYVIEVDHVARFTLPATASPSYTLNQAQELFQRLACAHRDAGFMNLYAYVDRGGRHAPVILAQHRWDREDD